MKIFYQDSIDFKNDLPQFECLIRNENGIDSVEQSPQMWLNALDILLKRASEKCDLSKIVAISGSGQQHGSVYWSENGLKVLENLNNDKLLHELFDENCFFFLFLKLFF